MELKIGDLAPEFEAVNTEKQKIKLSDFRGKPVVLLFFPFAFTSVCTAELCSVRDDLSVFNKVNAEVFGISVDSHHSLKKYKEEQHLNFNLLSDFNKTISSDYGCLYENFGGWMKGVSKRAVFIIDGEGVIQYMEVLENASHMPDMSALKQATQSL